MISYSQLQEIMKEWDLESYDSMLVFSDWLLDQGEVKWSNLIRWSIFAKKLNLGYHPLKLLDIIGRRMENYAAWEKWANINYVENYVN